MPINVHYLIVMRLFRAYRARSLTARQWLASPRWNSVPALCFSEDNAEGPRVRRLLTGKISLLTIFTANEISRDPAMGTSRRSHLELGTCSHFSFLFFGRYPRRGVQGNGPRLITLPETIRFRPRSNPYRNLVPGRIIYASHNNYPKYVYTSCN